MAGNDANSAEIKVHGTIPIERLGLLKHQLGMLMTEHSLEIMKQAEALPGDPWAYFIEKSYLSSKTPEDSEEPVVYITWENVRLFFHENSTTEYQDVRNSWSNLYYHHSFHHRNPGGPLKYRKCDCPLEVALRADFFTPESVIGLGSILEKNVELPRLTGHRTKRVITEFAEALESQLRSGDA
jgi:hypothetical protein